ncbi:MAG: hypothetical protein ACRCXD_07255 [Luteolibacter sp.]
MANNQFRVEIPAGPTETIKLLVAIKMKHEALGASSPLVGLKWAEISPALKIAAEQDQMSDDFRSKAEAATGARDAKMPLVKDSIRSARDVLMGLNRDNPDALGAFGFKVSDARSGNGGATPPVA